MAFARRSAVSTVGPSAGWVAALDRFTRAVHRFGDRVEVIPDRRLRDHLKGQAEVMDDALTQVRAASRGRVRGADVDGAVRAALRAGTACAQATEAALEAAAASRNRDQERLAEAMRSVEHKVEFVRQLADTYVRSMTLPT